MARHAGDEAYATMTLVLKHLPCHRRSRHEDARVVDVEHLGDVLRPVLRRRCDLLYPSRGNATIYLAVFVPDLVD